jgi:pyruvate formate lyase activating enzyme
MIVFDIKRYAINDGPGIRTTLFLKGCPLRCVWCHNPESWRPEPEWLFKAKKCIGCNTCGVYPNQLEWIKQVHTLPDREELAAELCPTLALEMCGQQLSVSQLLAEIEKERDIMIDSGGGVTISGGEPLRPLSISPRGGEGSLSHKTTTSGNATLPPTGGDGEGLLLLPRGGDGEGLLLLLHELGLRGIHRAIDTTLYASPDVVRAVAAEADLFLADLKVMDAEKHKRYTGVSNELIISNFRLLASLGVPFQVRIPLIEGVNADYENIRQAAIFIEELHPTNGVALLPYHEMGRDKHTRRGTTYNPAAYPLSTPSDATLQRCIQQFADHGITATVGG